MRCVALLGLLLAGWHVGFAAQAPTWVKVTAPDFVVLSPLKPREAAGWANEFAQYVEALRTFFRRERMRLPPLTIVVFSREREFDAFRPLRADGKPKEVAGFFSRRESWSVAALSSNASEEVRRTIFHEGAHWFLSVIDPPNPVWLEEGLAELFSTFSVRKNEAIWGEAIDHHVMLLRQQKPIPLERLLFTGQGELFGDDSVRTSLVYAQSWAFVHFLIFGKHDLPRSGFTQYASSLHSGGHPDEAFQKAFGRTYAEVDRLIASYIQTGSYYMRKQPLATLPTLETTTATTVEVEQALGRLALVAGRTKKSIEHARAVISAAPDDPRGHELLGLAAKVSDDPTTARAEFALAVQKGSKDFQPYFELAVLEQNGAIEEQGGLTPASARQVADRYEQAINLNPRFKLSFENLSSVIGMAEPWGVEDRRFLELGAQLFPNVPMIEVGIALLDRRGGDKAAARARLEKVLATLEGNSGKVATYIRQLQAGWENEEVFARIDELARAGRPTEALALIERSIEQVADRNVRRQLQAARESMEGMILSQKVSVALDERRWVDAREALNGLLESKAPIGVKANARRTLQQLDQRKLGLESSRTDAEKSSSPQESAGNSARVSSEAKP